MVTSCLVVTSREVVWLFLEQFAPEFVPVFHRLQGRPLGQCCLQKLLIVEHDIAQNGLLKVLAALEAMALQDVFDPAIESLDHAICLRSHWWRETMLDAEISAKLVELMLSRGRALAKAKQPVGESLSVVGQYPSDLHLGKDTIQHLKCIS